MSEDLEFLISQYVDGTLSAEERAAVEVRLAEDADAPDCLGSICDSMNGSRKSCSCRL